MMIFGKHLFRNVLFICFMLALLPSKSLEIEISDYSLTSIGETHLAAGRYIIAKQFFLGVLHFAQYIKDKALIRICYTRLGDAYWNLGQMDLSIVNYKKASMILRPFNLMNENKEAEAALEIHGLYSKAKDLRDNKKYQASIELFDKAILSTRWLGWSNHEVKCLRQKSIALYEMSDYIGYYLCNLEASQLAQQANNSREICLCNNNLGIYYYKKQNYDKALDRYYYAYDLAQIENFDDLINESISYISSVFIDIGNYKSAIKFLIHTININKKTSNFYALIGNLNNLGIVYKKYSINTGDLNYLHEALIIYYEALLIAWERKSERDEYTLISNISNVLKLLHKNEDALRLYKSVIKKALKYNDYLLYCDAQNNLGDMYLSENHFSNAKDCYEESIKIASINGYKKKLLEAYYGIAKIFEGKLKYEKAAEYFKQSIFLIEIISNDINSDILKAKYFDEYDYIYNNYLEVLRKIYEIYHSNEDEIFNFIEMQKAKSLAAYLRNKSNNIEMERLKIYQKESDRINIRIDNIQNEVHSKSISSIERFQMENESIVDENYLNRLVWKKSEAREIEMGIEKGIIKINDMINKIINEKTAIIEYHLSDNESYMLFITRNKKILIILPPRKEIENIVERYIKHISSNPIYRIDISEVSKSLYKAIMPSQNLIDSMKISNIIVIPDGILNYLPFETLIISERSENKYIIEKYNISYSPSISALYYLKEKKIIFKKKYLGIGDPEIRPKRRTNNKYFDNEYQTVYKNNKISQEILESIPYSRNEIIASAKEFDGQYADIYLGNNANEEIIKEKLADEYQIIHFACHTIVDETDSLKSAIILTASNKDDGILFLREISAIPMKTEIIILSACQTSRGNIQGREGVMGLARIFLYAGARSVISTLWSVYDKATMTFMKYYIKNLKNGIMNIEALKNAKIAMIKSKYSNPYFWAGFVLQGNFDYKIIK